MDREQILAMGPGRELDALVAEKVIDECRHEWEEAEPNVWDFGCPKCLAKFSTFPRAKKPIAGTDKPYSTDISAAWEIIERLDNQGIRFNMSRFYSELTPEIGTCWGVNFNTKDFYYHEVHTKTAPESICKAALLAVINND